MTMNLRRNLMGPYQRGVPSQYVVHYHPWPTRFHGPLYQRPVFNFPWMSSPQNVFKPGDFYPGELTEEQMSVQGLGADSRYQTGQEAMAYNVGRGIFKPGGYGGGIFDGNLSGDKVARPLGTPQRRRRRRRGMSGLGAATGPVPSTCWDSQAFKDCQARVFAKAQGDCPKTGYPNAAYPSYDDCVKDLAATYVGPSAESLTCVSQYCGGTAAKTATGAYPWGTYSAETLRIQKETNTALALKGFCPIVADGKLGPATCGARKALSDLGLSFPVPSTCQKFTAPTKPPCPGGAPGPVFEPGKGITTASMLPGAGPDWTMIAAFGVGAVAVLGIGYFLLTRKEQ
jgi:hypothetical protein